MHPLSFPLKGIQLLCILFSFFSLYFLFPSPSTTPTPLPRHGHRWEKAVLYTTYKRLPIRWLHTNLEGRLTEIQKVPPRVRRASHKPLGSSMISKARWYQHNTCTRGRIVPSQDFPPVVFNNSSRSSSKQQPNNPTEESCSTTWLFRMVVTPLTYHLPPTQRCTLASPLRSFATNSRL